MAQVTQQIDFAELPTAIRTRMGELSGAELKVWMTYFVRASVNGGKIASLSVKAISSETGLYHETVVKARQSLKRTKWLVPVYVSRIRGRFGLQRFSVEVPGASDWMPQP